VQDPQPLTLEPGSAEESSSVGPSVAAAEDSTAGDPEPAISEGGDADLDAEADSGTDAAATLAIDDADDFGDDGLEDGDEEVDEPDQPLPQATTTLAQEVLPRPLGPDSLPGSLYLLVDKTVELDARPLREFSELGSLPEDEQERQALMLYVNPRQAKRQCGRSQRVIKVPDSGVLQRTSRYLVAQGITRLVLEGGSLFAIPGS
jgi:hypothetical protein